jgi:hypothetical protein
MRRERALKVVLVVVGLIFCGLAYPLMMFVKQEPALAMMLSVYVTLGIFLLLASRNPSANRSLIAFTAWSSFAHAMLMAGQAFARLIARGELIGSAVLIVIGVALIALAPGSDVALKDVEPVVHALAVIGQLRPSQPSKRPRLSAPDNRRFRWQAGLGGHHALSTRPAIRACHS